MNEKLCVFCKHWQFDGGSAGYSELTPGYNGTMECSREQFPRIYFDELFDSDDFRKHIKRAETCDVYHQVTT